MSTGKSTGKFFLFFFVFIAGAFITSLGLLGDDAPVWLRIFIFIVGLIVTVFGLTGMGRHNDGSSKGPFNFGN